MSATEPQSGRQRGARREVILDALSEALKEKPLAKISVDELATASEISRQRLYHYYDSKYEALAHLIERVSRQLMEVYFQPGSWFVRPEETKPRDALIFSFEAIISLYARNAQVIREVSDLWNAPPSVREHWERFMTRLVDATTVQIQRERHTGLAPAGPDARHIAYMLLWQAERLQFLEWAESSARIEFSAGLIEDAVTLWMRAIYLEDDPPARPRG